MSEIQNGQTGTLRLKTGLAEMLKGGVIMDVVTADQAKIAEDAGATSVMALERVPADIRAEGGVSRMSSIEKLRQIMESTSIPVMAKCRIGHFAEAQMLQALGIDYVDESEVLTPADEHYHVDKFAFEVPFVCGCRNLGRGPAADWRGRGPDPHQGRGWLGQHRRGRAPHALGHRRDPPANDPASRTANDRGQRPRRTL